MFVKYVVCDTKHTLYRLFYQLGRNAQHLANIIVLKLRAGDMYGYYFSHVDEGFMHFFLIDQYCWSLSKSNYALYEPTLLLSCFSAQPILVNRVLYCVNFLVSFSPSAMQIYLFVERPSRLFLNRSPDMSEPFFSNRHIEKILKTRPFCQFVCRLSGATNLN